jgi:tRNA-modifying protein YgfZ
MGNITSLAARGVIEIAGTDRVSFLNGLVSNDVTQAAPGGAVWAALLTPQGRYVADFFIFAAPESLLLDAPSSQLGEILRRLGRYRLRADVRLADVSDRFGVAAGWNGAPMPERIAAPDPRLAEAGWRAIVPRENLPPDTGEAAYHAHRIALGLPDGPPDLEADKTLLLEANFDVLNGVSWTKGCYMGQELTARTHYRGLVKRRLVPVTVEGPLPAPGTAVMNGDTEAGTIRSGAGNLALAMLRTESLESPLEAGAARVVPRRPAWFGGV